MTKVAQVVSSWIESLPKSMLLKMTFLTTILKDYKHIFLFVSLQHSTEA